MTMMDITLVLLIFVVFACELNKVGLLLRCDRAFAFVLRVLRTEGELLGEK